MITEGDMLTTLPAREVDAGDLLLNAIDMVRTCAEALQAPTHATDRDNVRVTLVQALDMLRPVAELLNPPGPA